jgi:hypothetical protein
VTASSDYQKLRAHLAFLRMGAAAEALPGLLEQAAQDNLSSQAFLERLLAVEVGAVDERRRVSLERFAALPSPFTLADFDYSAQPSVDPKLITDLGTLRFIDDIGNPLYQNLLNDPLRVSPASEMGPVARHDLGAIWPGYVSIMVPLGSGLAGGGGPGGLGGGWPGGGGRAAAEVAVAVAAGGGGGLGHEVALVVAFEAELVLGVLGTGAPGVGQGLGGGQLGGAGGGRRAAFAGGVGADVVVFGAGVCFGLPGPADLGVGVVACLVSGGQRGVPAGVRGTGLVAGLGQGRGGFPAGLGELGVCLVADGLGAGIGGVGVGAGGVGGLQRGLRIVPGGVHRRGGGLPGLVGSGGPGQGDRGLGLCLAAGGIGCGQRRGDPAGVSGGQLGGGGAGQVGGLGEQLLQAGQRAAGGGGLQPGVAGGEAVVVVPLPGARRAAEQAGCAASGGGGQPGAASGLLAAARGARGGRRRLIKRAGGDLAGHGRGLSIFIPFPLGEEKE